MAENVTTIPMTTENSCFGTSQSLPTTSSMSTTAAPTSTLASSPAFIAGSDSGTCRLIPPIPKLGSIELETGETETTTTDSSTNEIETETETELVDTPASSYSTTCPTKIEVTGNTEETTPLVEETRLPVVEEATLVKGITLVEVSPADHTVSTRNERQKGTDTEVPPLDKELEPEPIKGKDLESVKTRDSTSTASNSSKSHKPTKKWKKALSRLKEPLKSNKDEKQEKSVPSLQTLPNAALPSNLSSTHRQDTTLLTPTTSHATSTGTSSSSDSVLEFVDRDHLRPQPSRLRRLSTKIEHISDEISEALDKTFDDISTSLKHQQYRIEDTINYQHYRLHTVLDKATKGKGVEPIKPADRFERLPVPFWLKFIPVKQGDGEESLLMMDIGIDERMTKNFDEEVIGQVLHQGQAAVREYKLYRDQEKMEELIAALNREVVVAQTVKERLEKEASEKRQVQRPLEYYKQLDLLKKRLHDDRRDDNSKEPLPFYAPYRTYGRTTSDDFPVLYGESSHWGEGPPAREYMEDLRETPRRFWKEFERKLKWVEKQEARRLAEMEHGEGQLSVLSLRNRNQRGSESTGSEDGAGSVLGLRKTISSFMFP
ncbi:hypothetical protein BJ508DRAFT_350576 [Ascobolus immersus RN42]|uniref:Uncharacterized protein n=1 Tax=Ascobolus immersus RN42 TaxID=1160509 RepID=A0A3N4HU33_ASCIM|nr:hypothetical protein BJ508DRAFT_350576 [Ascobolus immersus RN42]